MRTKSDRDLQDLESKPHPSSVRLVRTAAMPSLAITTVFHSGCQAEKENIGWDYGKAYHTVFEAQKIAPAVVDDKPVDSMGGTRAALAYDRLEKQAPDEKKQGSGGFEAFLQQK